jgi:glyoxylase-like metal-dependent hydrolase (beta-lactamase superfamily II)
MPDSTYTLHRISLVNVAAYLIYRPGQAILVDSGNAGSEQKILEAMRELGLNPSMLTLIILTHAHFDHAGSAARLKELTGCQVLVQVLDADKLGEGYTSLPPGTRWKAKILVGLGRIFARRMGKFPPVDPDILVQDSFDLEKYGFPGKVYHTPGHTPGSAVVLLEGGELIGGDTVFGVENKQHFPPFAEDLPALVESWRRIRELPVKTIYPAHGRYFSFDSFLAEFDGAMERYS